MSDPSPFTSLMAMVESHLSKTSLLQNETNQNQAGPSFSLPNICNVRNTDSDQFLLPPPTTVMQLPRFEVKNSEITEILAQQVKNMLIAKENEKQKLTDNSKDTKLKDSENDDYMVDLTASIIRPGQLQSGQDIKLPTISKSSSEESLFSEIDNEIDITKQEAKVEALPMCEDMSYILNQRVHKGKCSSFGKVLTSRLRPVAAPYLHVKISHPEVVPFDFLTPSPCDINKMKRLHPPVDHYAHMNMVDRFMALTKDEG